ncbi:methylisocitrate lyase, involved in propionate catabolism [Corynebacterium glutamicum MB001]|uniref:Probable 2-methylisocitrate lyase 2 n=1 Tax=Corynebacterium glutamicum (strain ATCC 13032 / DSM 20300 / JCM 1318 / BCRC 11384 / CCUG 27702 / LMG 3730 / NBRC 12168 / NCIMB 10025 / NRRL B-2784 / 534) TaxID=196627 RepID=PRPB2_CORGL|nr:methylisocitrate lyase [Corynebacterium glutamicum]Q8NSL2.1 RecName: Full=Probable 2-methylisocitrate lyase 2; Short=2-MIC; Short=MICL; AltName: Full=(2R,3S)-2-methylisocitrate lyase [Corynebacterium glutamicum ATCC 13032]AAM21505.1 PrpB2 [Corynebacterium glutamicum]AGT04651.1 methylisocitrate lyase, involved in propionate catabolism [Corynebacterium glutamicum MB001]ASW13382.1 methylisocitrate lyase, involved in propionate catabolism [Corynebacterium glutamicum]MBA4569010.1 methylisocitrat
MAGLFSSAVAPTERRKALRAALAAPEIARMPGAFSPLAARAIQEAGFEGVYVSGAVVAADLALPDIGLTTLTEVAHRSRQIARVTDLPVLVDADTGFGEPMSAARTVSELEDAGVAGCHLEDQVNPKRCGHLDGKEVVGTDIMVRRIAAAVNERRDEQFVICARTDAAGVEGIDSAIERAKAYADAGADMIFTEALYSPADFEKFRAAVDIPLLANMTEFGKTELLPAQLLEDIGYNAVIYPVTLLRIAMGQVEQALGDIANTGIQTDWVDRMQHRSRLYELLRYNEYNAFDQQVFTYSADSYKPIF